MPARLYHGTNEKIAKMAPSRGIHSNEPIALTGVYGIYQAFMSAGPRERWAIVEIAQDRLQEANLFPALDLLPDRLKEEKGRTWKQSLETVGFCLYNGAIPAAAVRKLWIYNPQSNWLITSCVLQIELGPEHYDKDLKRLSIINRWLTGEYVGIEQWLAEQEGSFSREQIEEMGARWSDRSGLDLFYHG
jgi:hypothetical protein